MKMLPVKVLDRNRRAEHPPRERQRRPSRNERHQTREPRPVHNLEPLEPSAPQSLDMELGWRPRGLLCHQHYGPTVQLGQHLRLQAEVGHRAVIMFLRPGLYLVAEMPDAHLRPDFGLAPILAPLMLNAAAKALENPAETQAALQKTLNLIRPHNPAQPQAPSSPPESPSTAGVYSPVSWAGIDEIYAVRGAQYGLTYGL